VHSSYPHDLLEIFIVDGGSTDRTPEVVQQYREETDIRIRWHSEKGLRNSPSRNYAIRETDQDVLVFADDDCLTSPDWIGALVGPLARGEADITASDDRAPDDDPFLARCEDVAFGSVIGSGGVRSSGGSSPLRFCPMTCNMAMFRQAALDIGLFDERLRVAEDTEFAYRAKEHGLTVLFVPQAKVLHRRRAALRSIFFHNYIRGYSRSYLYRECPSERQKAFLAPAAGLLLGTGLLLGGLIFPWLWLVLAAGVLVYAFLLVCVGIEGVRTVRHPLAFFVVPALVAIHHFWYAVGTLHAPLTGYRKVFVSYLVNVSDPYGRERKTGNEK
jgi:glycosyltransferase involved in cell wall biosynthesis